MWPTARVWMYRETWLHRRSHSANQWSFASWLCSLWTLSWSINFVNQSEWFRLDCFLRVSANEWSFSEIKWKRFILASSESRNRRQNFSFDNPTALSLPVMILRSLMQWSTEWEVERENRFVHFAKKKFVIQDWYFDCGVLVILYHRKLVKERRNYFLVTGRNKRDSQGRTGVCEIYSGA